MIAVNEDEVVGKCIISTSSIIASFNGSEEVIRGNCSIFVVDSSRVCCNFIDFERVIRVNSSLGVFERLERFDVDCIDCNGS